MFYAINQNKNSYKTADYYRIVKEYDNQKQRNKAIIADTIQDITSNIKDIVKNYIITQCEKRVLYLLMVLLNHYKSGFNGISLKRISGKTGYAVQTILDAITRLNKRFSLGIFSRRGVVRLNAIETMKEKIYGFFLPHRMAFLKARFQAANPPFKQWQKSTKQPEPVKPPEPERRYNPLQPIGAVIQTKQPEPVKPPETLETKRKKDGLLQSIAMLEQEIKQLSGKILKNGGTANDLLNHPFLQRKRELLLQIQKHLTTL